MFQLPSPLEEINHEILKAHHVKLYIKRDDLIHPEISGNKWRKLKYNFQEAKSKGYSKIITFGGAFSNHIAASAAAAKYFEFEITGIIRGKELSSDSNQTLRQAANHGMLFRFVTRKEFRDLRKDSNLWMKKFPNHFVIPEGGCNEAGMKGVSEIIDEIQIPFDTIICPIGTGTTFAGLSSRLETGKVMGISALKGDFIKDEIAELHQKFGLSPIGDSVQTDFHFGGYGKTTNVLIEFINEIKAQLDILFDPIYTGKAFFGVWKMIQEGIFDGQTLIFLHTGGLQGIVGFNQKSPQKIHI